MVLINDKPRLKNWHSCAAGIIVCCVILCAGTNGDCWWKVHIPVQADKLKPFHLDPLVKRFLIVVLSIRLTERREVWEEYTLLKVGNRIYLKTSVECSLNLWSYPCQHFIFISNLRPAVAASESCFIVYTCLHCKNIVCLLSCNLWRKIPMSFKVAQKQAGHVVQHLRLTRFVEDNMCVLVVGGGRCQLIGER